MFLHHQEKPSHIPWFKTIPSSKNIPATKKYIKKTKVNNIADTWMLNPKSGEFYKSTESKKKKITSGC